MEDRSLNGDRTPREGLFASPRWVWAVIGLLTLIGAVFRIKTAGASLIGDELSTFWIVDGRSFRDVIDIVYSDSEISPPFTFILAWSATKLGSSPELIRVPSLIAGVGAIPLVYAIGIRILGRWPALLASAVVTVSPFMVFYSANARAYSVAMTMVLLSTLGLLLAAESGRKRWWALYGVGSLLALYSHYTMAFVLVGQLVWLLWAFPEARKAAIITNVVAALFYLPWIGGFVADNSAVTIPILEALQGDGFSAKLDAVEQILFFRFFVGDWGVGRAPDIWLITLGALAAGGGVAVRWAFTRVRPKLPGVPEQKRGLILALVLTLSTAIGEGLLLLVGTDIFGARNLAATWLGLPLLIGAVVMLNNRYWAVFSATLLLAGFSYGSLRVADPARSSSDYPAAAGYAAAQVAGGGSVIDAAHLTPCPLGATQLYLPASTTVYRPGLPDLDDVDFIQDFPVSPLPQPVVDQAFAGEGPVAVVTFGGPETATDRQFLQDRTGGYLKVPAGWTITDQKSFEGVEDLTVTTYKRKPEGSE